MSGRYQKVCCDKCDRDFWAAADSIKDGQVKCKCGHLVGIGPRQCFICLEASASCTCYTFVTNESWTSKRCQHKPCFRCMQQYVSVKIEEGCWNIRCPGESCKHMLLEADIKRFACSPGAGQPHGLFEKYCKLRSASHGEHLCSILRGQAFVAQTQADDEVCATVAATTALPRSRSSSSSGETAERDSPSEFEDWALSSCQACPKCLVVVRKEIGCDHIQCKCGTDFQYCCGYPSGANGSCCACRSKIHGRDVELPRLGRWLRVHSRLDIHMVPAVVS
jgi:hypothetical protein